MYKNYSIFSFCILLLLVASMSAEEVNVTGDWEMTFTTPRGDEMTRDIHFEQEGEKLTVTMQGRRGEVTAEGTVKGSEIEWTITRSTPRGEFTMTYTGKIEGDTMSGEVQMADFGSSEWKAKKK